MSTSDDARLAPLAEWPTQELDVPIARLVDEVFESSPAAVQNTMLSQLVASVYEVAAPPERKRMLEQLLLPMGVLSLVAVANGIFARIRFHNGWHGANIRLEDAQRVAPSDVVALVNRAQQISVHAVNGLADMLMASPVLAASASAALLLKILLRRAQIHRHDDDELNP